MVRYVNTFLTLTLGLVLLNGCRPGDSGSDPTVTSSPTPVTVPGGDSGSDPTVTSSPTPVTVPGDDPTPVPTQAAVDPTPIPEAGLNLAPGSAVLSAAAATLNSAGTLLISTGASLNLQGGGDDGGGDDSGGGGDAVQSSQDPLCTTNGSPWDADNNTEMADNDSDYPERLFYCAAFSQVTGSPDTIAGTLDQNIAIICTIEQHFSLTAASYAATETELINSAPEAISLTTTCWPNGTPDGIASLNFDSVKIQALDPATTGFSHRLRMTSSEADIDIEIKSFNSNGVFGFARNDYESISPGVGDDIRMTVDTNRGAMLFNYIGDRNGGGGADSAYRTLVRVRVTGTIAATDLSFSSIDEIQGFYTISETASFNAADGSTFGYNAYTVDGNAANGYQYRHYRHTNDGTPVQVSVNCTGGAETCSSSEALGTVEELHALKSKSTATALAWADLIANGKPLCEPSVAGEFNFEPAPIYSGPLGTCNEAPGRYTCNQSHVNGNSRNCSAGLFTAASLQAAADHCRAAESNGGEGCCTTGSVFINAWGAVTGFEVVPAGNVPGEGTSYTCP